MFLTTELADKVKIRSSLTSGEYLQGAGDMNLCQIEIINPREKLSPKNGLTVGLASPPKKRNLGLD